MFLVQGRISRICAIALAVLLLIPILPTAVAVDYDQGCVDLPDLEDTIVEIDYDESYDGFYDDYFDEYGFTDSEGNFNFALAGYTEEENYAIANAYIKYSEYPEAVAEYGTLSLEQFVEMYSCSGADSPGEFLIAEFSLADNGSSIYSRSSSDDWYYDTGTSLPAQAVYGGTNLIPSVRKGDLIYEDTGTLAASIVGHIAVVEGVFWDSESDRFYIRLIEAIW